MTWLWYMPVGVCGMLDAPCRCTGSTNLVEPARCAQTQADDLLLFAMLHRLLHHLHTLLLHEAHDACTIMLCLALLHIA
jgi:hypothetical protein